jgi:hypothetical protein
MYVTTAAFDALVLAGLIEHTVGGPYDGPLYGALSGLFKNQLQPTKGTVYADLGEVTVGEVPGYAQVALAPWGAAINEADGSLTMVSAALEFRATADPAAPIDVWGVLIVDTTGPPGALIAADLFSEKFTFEASGDGRVILVSWNEHPTNPSTITTVIS